MMEKGIYAAALTPLHEDYSCDHEELAIHCSDLIERGCKGIVLMGTTGEGPSFSVQECKEALEKLLKYGFDPSKLILSNSAGNLPNTLSMIELALHFRCSSILISPPCFFKNITEEGVLAFYRNILKKIPTKKLQVLLYHIPQMSGVPITAKIIKHLRGEFPEIVIGIKESEGNLNFVKEIIDLFPNFQVFVGNESQIIEATKYGASGAVCGLANIFPDLICNLFSGGKNKNPEQLINFFEALENLPFIAAFKAAIAKKKGNHWNRLRPPLVSLSNQQEEAFFSRINDKETSWD